MAYVTRSIESWKPIEGYEASYEVSDSGRVRSVARGRVLKPQVRGRGYLGVTLYREKVAKNKYIHHLVAQAFIGDRPVGLMVCHDDGDMNNCAVTNLRYGTQSSNLRDTLLHGTHGSVGRTHCNHGHELTPSNVYLSFSKSNDGGQKSRKRCRACPSIAMKAWYKRRHGAT